jgi:6-phosphofructokinase 1
MSYRLADDLIERGYSTKVCILGHTQRGGTPTAHDRVLASVLGASAVAYLLAGQSDSMVGVRNGQVVRVPFKQVIGKKKKIPSELMSLAQILAL